MLNDQIRRLTEKPSRLTALVVPVPAADEAIGHWRRQYTKSGRRGMPAHVTLVTPWMQTTTISDSTLDTLASCGSEVGSFEFALTRLDSFPQGVLFLAVEPRAPFVSLIQAICDAFPDYPPYAGEFAPLDVIPHVTVAVAEGYPAGPSSDDLEVFRRVVGAVGPTLPIRAAADQLELWEDGESGWHVTNRVALH